MEIHQSYMEFKLSVAHRVSAVAYMNLFNAVLNSVMWTVKNTQMFPLRNTVS
jgi:succinate dehydrogenase/fumarate reductase cytochrome b subunit